MMRAKIATRAGSSTSYPQPREGIDWRSLGFGLATRRPVLQQALQQHVALLPLWDSKMIVANCSAGSMWGELRSEPYGVIPLEPAATILNYGQGIFEGIKAYRTERGRIVLFRPQKNGKRMADGARRMLMPPLPPSLFLQACSKAVTENADLVPPCGQGALYLRPLLFGSGADLGVKPSSQYVFCVFVPGGSGVR
ncbi:unnamed protein product [Prorocentrum cordatum]|uniref:Branched-chain-amino-acid transaminase n=1 Tax=Prorocentrum cordatum TaxID=2364126 RepID=A0ABN9TGR1_9DINO|nr:unnamed protein product [Polarella glacialis]